MAVLLVCALAVVVPGCSGARDDAKSGSPSARVSGPLEERAQDADRMAEEALRLAGTDPRAATSLAIEAAGLGHGPTVVQALGRLTRPYLAQYLTGAPGDGTYTVLGTAVAGRIVAGGSTAGAVTVWDTYSGRRRLHERLGAPVQRLAVSNGMVAARTTAGEVAVWELTSGRRVVTDTVPADGNSGLAVIPSGSRSVLTYGNGAGITLKDTLSWSTTGTLPAGPAGSVTDLAPIRHPHSTRDVLAGVGDGVRLRLWNVGGRREGGSYALSTGAADADRRPHVFGGQSYASQTPLTGPEGTRLLLLKTVREATGDIGLEQEFLDNIPITGPPPAVGGDGAGDDETLDEAEPAESGGGIAMAALAGLHSIVAVHRDDPTRAVVRSRVREPVPATIQTLYPVAPPGRRITAVTAWTDDYFDDAPVGALALDDGRVAVWNFNSSGRELNPSRERLDDELARLCGQTPIVPEKDEWSRWTGSKVPYRPVCRELEQRNHQGRALD